MPDMVSWVRAIRDTSGELIQHTPPSSSHGSLRLCHKNGLQHKLKTNWRALGMVVRDSRFSRIIGNVSWPTVMLTFDGVWPQSCDCGFNVSTPFKILPEIYTDSGANIGCTGSGGSIHRSGHPVVPSHNYLGRIVGRRDERLVFSHSLIPLYGRQLIIKIPFHCIPCNRIIWYTARICR